MTSADRLRRWRDAHPHSIVTLDVLTELFGDDLTGRDFRGCDLSHANLEGGDFRRTMFCRANLQGALLVNADLRQANLFWANLSGADLNGAHLNGADLFGANLSGAGKWGGLRLDGLASGQVTMVPTPNGWVLNVGCWSGTVDELEALASGDSDWPEAKGEERDRRRPTLLSLVPLLKAHQEYHHDKLVAVQKRWTTMSEFEVTYEWAVREIYYVEAETAAEAREKFSEGKLYRSEVLEGSVTSVEEVDDDD